MKITRIKTILLKNRNSIVLIILCGLLLLSCGQSIRTFPKTEADFSFVAIGDTGKEGEILDNNAGVLKKMLQENPYDALVFLGDNFYPIGLNGPRREADKKRDKVLKPLLEIGETLPREHIHAVAGNHDYYAFLAVQKKFLFGLFNIEAGPYGRSDRGNLREAEIDFWTYYYNMPADKLYGPQDNQIQMLFFDSSRPLRTDQETWSPALDSLYQLLTAHKDDETVKWRLLFLHHPFYTLGPHGGYNYWDEDSMRVEFVSPCDKDANAIGFAQNFLDPEDVCAEKYQAYIDSVRAVIARSGVKVQAVFAGHEHTLQFINYPEVTANCEPCPSIQIVSGAGAKANRVKTTPSGQFNEVTWPVNTPDKQGESRYGFVRVDLVGEHLELRYYDGRHGDLLTAGEHDKFVINLEGELVGPTR